MLLIVIWVLCLVCLVFVNLLAVWVFGLFVFCGGWILLFTLVWVMVLFWFACRFVRLFFDLVVY